MLMNEMRAESWEGLCGVIDHDGWIVEIVEIYLIDFIYRTFWSEIFSI